MRILQTGDWHLGRKLQGIDLSEDQHFVLEQVLDVAKEARPDLLLIAGDVYDRADPPPAAVELLSEVLSRLVLDMHLRVLILAGNHDSPERLGFCADILKRQGIMVAAEAGAEPLALKDGGVQVFALPYLDPELVAEGLGREGVRGQQAAMEAVLAGVRERMDPSQRTVLAGHAFVQGGTASESERPLVVGGSGAVDASLFDLFDYVAMGHLHRPQVVAGRVYYSGSLLSYSISEADQEKVVLLVDVPPSGPPEVERVPLRPKRRVRKLEGTLQEILEKAATDQARDDLVFALLRDRVPVPDAMQKLRHWYPNACHLDWVSRQHEGEAVRFSGEVLSMQPIEMFKLFYKAVSGSELDEADLKLVIPVFEQVLAEREKT